MGRVKRETHSLRTSSIVHIPVVLGHLIDPISLNGIKRSIQGNAGLFVMFARRTLSPEASLRTITGDTREKDLSSAMYAETNLDTKAIEQST